METRRVLVVDDERAITGLLYTALTGLGYGVECAMSAGVARQKIRDGGFVVAIIDCLIPGGSGTDLAALAKEHGVGVVLMSGHPAMIEAPESDFRFLRKPFRLLALKEAIDAAVIDAQQVAG
jgi:DNA-binding NtrC family response regulator